MLAFSGTTAVPAFFFLRPSVSIWRWNDQGDHGQHSYAAQLWRGEYSFLEEASNSGILAPTLGYYPNHDIRYRLCNDLQPLYHNILTSHFEDGLLYWQIAKEWRTYVCQESTREEASTARYELMRYIVLSLPEPFAETLWELISLHSKESIISTVIPKLEDSYQNEPVLQPQAMM